MTPTRARLGTYGKHVHGLALAQECAPTPDLLRAQGIVWPRWWGVSECGVWAGAAWPTDHPVTCRECLRRMKA